MEHQFNGNLARTFNTAKKYAEEILFPKMDLFQKYQRQAEFGSEDLNESLLLNQEIRDIQRFNGIKAMNNILYSLLLNVKSTVMVNAKKVQINELNKMLETSSKLKNIFDEEKERFFEDVFRNGRQEEKLNRNYFNRVKELIEKMYVNAEILMTKNKLLFAENNEEYMDDKELIAKIKEEYIEG